MYIVMEANKLKVEEAKTGTVGIQVSDETAALKIYVPNESIKLNIGEFKQEIKTLELMECVQEAFETGVFFIDSLEEYILGLESDRDRVLMELATLKWKMERGM